MQKKIPKYSFLLLTIALSFLSRCSTTVKFGKLAKYNLRYKNDKNIENGKTAISINLFDLNDKNEIEIANVKTLPGLTIDSSNNYKLLLFDSDSIPSNIRIDKPGKIPIPIYPKKGKKNLIIYKIYLGDDIRGIM
ncbi:hypothetical protein U0038_13680 [Sphingobacterium spiritivorum]|nr:hypothetical protein [Sphingobacterium spiritivorum]WQD32563.1 hypothetical protein U0038_13680 [Sphingobacterium spiritivorum]SUJ11093.1 Uncharacterised protein [Sphingobacterium spiritivorum]